MQQTQNPVTLVMLLSMSKLQLGEAPKGGFVKRRQTPEEAHAQIHEAAAHVKSTGRELGQIVLLYTDTLYLNSEKPGIELIQKYQDATLRHRRKITALFADDSEKLPVTDMLWSELVQSQKEYQQPRARAQQLYQTHPGFRLAVQNDNPRRKGVTDPLVAEGKNKFAKGTPPTPDDMFVIEEAGLFHGLARGYLASEKVADENDLIIAYPGHLMQSLATIEETPLRIYNGHPQRSKELPRQASWLDLSDPEQPEESLFYDYQPSAGAAPKNMPPTRKPLSPFLRLAGKAAAVLLPPLVLAATWLAPMPEKPLKNKIIESEDEMLVTWYTNPKQTVTLRFEKDLWKNHQKGDDGYWSASAVSDNNSPIMRPLKFRDDVGYIYTAREILSHETPENTEHLIYSNDPIAKQPQLKLP
ncbi:MAG: hypothetical protein JWM96_535 [Alphaproteobacteria bacterium]|nr:hypothetical protein [Alphaproteobacteria bacterium]